MKHELRARSSSPRARLAFASIRLEYEKIPPVLQARAEIAFVEKYTLIS